MIEDIESSVDTFHDDMIKFNLKEFDPIGVLRRKDAKANHARIIKTWYLADGADYEYPFHPDKNKENDQDQLAEAYGHLTKTDKQKANDLYKKPDEIQGEVKDYVAVPVEGDEFEMVTLGFPLPLPAKIMMGFPPKRQILRLDPNVE